MGKRDICMAPLVAQLVRICRHCRETWVQSLWEDPLEVGALALSIVP